MDIEVVREFKEKSYLETLGNLLREIKKRGLITFITVSWTRPYNVCELSGNYDITCGDEDHKFRLGGQIMDFLIKSPDLDYLSPQMYASGKEVDDSESHFSVNFLNKIWGYNKFKVFH